MAKARTTKAKTTAKRAAKGAAAESTTIKDAGLTIPASKGTREFLRAGSLDVNTL